MMDGLGSTPRWMVVNLCVFLAGSWLGGCAPAMAREARYPLAPPAEPAPMPASTAEGAPKQPPTDKPAGATPGSPSETSRATMLIYKADLALGVFETSKSIDKVEKIAIEAGGYLVARNSQEVTVRVPVEKFRDALAAVTKLGDVLDQNVKVQDVTAQYYDLEIRIRNAEAMRARLEQLLAKANKVEDALAVEKELERVAGELERLKGQLRLWRELVSFSTIAARFQPVATERLDNKFRLPFGWLKELGLGRLLNL
jgi:hypothetical protein